MELVDKLLLEARDYSIRMESLAATDLITNIDSYLEPSWTVRKLLEGYKNYCKSSKNSEYDYLLLRKAFTETKGKSHQVFNNVLASHISSPKYDYSNTIFTPPEGKDNKEEYWENVAKTGLYHLNHFGFWKARFRVPDGIVKSLKDKIMKQFTVINGNDIVTKMLNGSEDAPMQIKSDAQWLSTFEEIFEISSDPVLLSIVNKYLGVPPIFNTPVSFLNSYKKVKKQRELSDAAQLYHHDMHRMGFVKMFVYLTDVDMESGPHTLIKGTHRDRPNKLWSDGRHADAVIEQTGILKDEVKIEGKAGTIFLVDTSALHKGSHPTANSRLMAQVQYTNSLFGRPLAATDNKIEQFTNGNKSTRIIKSSNNVRKYAEKAGIRFMQNYI